MIALPAWIAIVTPLLAVAAILVGLGRVLSRLDTIATEHTAARAESKAQHEETRREIASLREARVEGEARTEHLRGDVEQLRAAIAEMRAEMLQHTAARHELRGELQSLRAEVEREAPRASRPRGGR